MDSLNRPETEADRPAVLPERRAWVRYGCDLEASCHTKGRLKDLGWTAQIRNLSQGGLGLVLRHRFQPGTPLVIELRSPNRSFCRECPVRVIRAVPVMVDGQAMWFLGCTFLEPLGEEELQQLV